MVQFEVDFDRGLDITKDVLMHAISNGWVQKKGAWFVFDEETKMQGEIKAKDHMRDSGLLDQWYNTLMTGEVPDEG